MPPMTAKVYHEMPPTRPRRCNATRGNLCPSAEVLESSAGLVRMEVCIVKQENSCLPVQTHFDRLRWRNACYRVEEIHLGLLEFWVVY